MFSVTRFTFAAALFAGATVLAQPTIVAMSGMSPSDLSNDGHVVVGRSNDVFRWERYGAPSVTMLPGSSLQDSVYCDADGNVLASTIRNTALEGGFPANRLFAARWDDAAPGWNSMGLVPTGDDCDAFVSNPYELSADGRFVVGLAWVTSCRAHAFQYDAVTGVITDLGVLGGSSSRANDVSADGTVVVGFDHHPTTSVRRPAVWMDGVEKILNADGGEIYALNDAGTIAVGASFAFPGDLIRWTLVDDIWVEESLGNLPAFPSWVPPSTNNFGVIGSSLSEDGTTIVGQVRYQQIGGGPFFSGAILYTDDLGMVDMRDYMAAVGAIGHSTIGEYNSAFRVSSDGRTILGVATFNAFLIDLDGAPCVPPVVGRPTPNATQNANTTAIFNTGAAATAVGLTYQWRWNGIPLANGFTINGSTATGATTNQLRISASTCGDQGYYDCVITNECGTVTTVQARLTINGCVLGDIDGDGSVNIWDGALLADCMTGPSGGVYPGCGRADLDSDGDVDLGDWSVLTAEMPAE